MTFSAVPEQISATSAPDFNSVFGYAGRNHNCVITNKSGPRTDARTSDSPEGLTTGKGG